MGRLVLICAYSANDSRDGPSPAPMDGINILDLGITNPSTQADVQSIGDKLNELITSLHW